MSRAIARIAAGPWRAAAVAAAAVILLCACWQPLLLGGLIPVDGNLMTLSFPHWAQARAAFLGGHLPLWDPSRDMGEPLLADPQAMILYPPLWLGALLPSFAAFLRYWIVLHSLLAAGAAAALAWRRTRVPAACAAAALVYGAGGALLARGTFPNHFAAAAWLPAALLALDLRAPRLLGAVLTLAWLAGFPPLFLVCAASGLAVAAVSGRDALGALARGALWAGGFAAAQSLPFLEMVLRSGRGMVLGSAQAAQYSLTAAELAKEIFRPQWDRFGAFLTGDPAIKSFYAGLVALMLGAWALRSGGRRERKLALATAAALLLSLGGNLPGFRFLTPLHVFRFPANWLLAASLGAALLAAAGVAALPGRARWAAVACLAVDLIGFARGPRQAWALPGLLDAPPLARAAVEAGGRIYHAPPVMAAWQRQTLETGADYDAMREFLAPSFGTAFGATEAASYQVLRQTSAENYLERLASAGAASPLLDWARVGTVVTLRRGAERADAGSLVAVRRPVTLGRVFLPGEPGASVALAADEPARVAAEIDSSRGGLAALSEAAYPGWRARVDGRPVPVETFEGVFLAAPVPAGRHRLEFCYRSDAFLWGAAVSLAALAAALVL